MAKPTDEEAGLIPVTEGSGNVFADLGLADSEEELAKAQLAAHIRRIVEGRRLTQVAAAQVMGIDQPKVSALLNGRLAGFSSDRLMRFLITSVSSKYQHKAFDAHLAGVHIRPSAAMGRKRWRRASAARHQPPGSAWTGLSGSSWSAARPAAR